MDAALQPSVRDLSEPTHWGWPTVRRAFSLVLRRGNGQHAIHFIFP